MWRYLIVCGINGKLYTLFTSSLFSDLSEADIVQSFSAFGFLPLSTGGSLVVMVIVPSLWILTLSSPGWNIVVYPSSDILLTLRRDPFSPGNTSASLAALVSVSNGSLVRQNVLRLALFGRYTSLLNALSVGKFKSLLMKCDVALEWMIILCSCRLAMRLVHLFDFCSVVVAVDLIMLISSFSS